MQYACYSTCACALVKKKIHVRSSCDVKAVASLHPCMHACGRDYVLLQAVNIFFPVFGEAGFWMLCWQLM
jgi:hypothetical protein